ncbi:antibiotic biosynthesis monooxygenase [Bradyrhizobium sp. LTSPM299]|jgi:heme-degrading monooxygenase HmoA|uniref:antibiotic biosynthesis monooxygenase family protein n=1 Tax=Bradyrhizobium sp. LTSPM299 TaxID=1619233 RepID=UPI0005CA7C67|nr:antibiotic biosynthesis monooxygenase [Bradyrhizobium sp. LTSPM299]KJC58273.1 antibiotic biosynthesis monooxygenase [Bradyrhizobium sp. LTSPM299]
MFSVIFEVHPNDGRKDDYLAQAKHLKPILETVDGFVDNERFESMLRPGWVLSHSTWRDEKSVVRWRTESEHHSVQEKGRFDIFSDYHLRIGDVTADTAPPKQAPIREQRFDETETGKAKVVTFTEITPAKGAAFASRAEMLAAHLGLDANNGAVTDYDVWSSIYNPGKLALLVGWKDAKAADSWQPKQIDGIEALRHRKVRVVRDYGRFDRREAPQYYPDVKGRETRHPELVSKAAAS